MDRMRFFTAIFLVFSFVAPVVDTYAQDNNFPGLESMGDLPGVPKPIEDSEELNELMEDLPEDGPDDNTPIAGGPINLDGGELEKEETPGIPSEFFITIGTALFATSFARCLKPFSKEKIPLLALVTAASIFLVQEFRTKDDYKNKSELLLKVEGEGDRVKAVGQKEAFEKARDQSELAAEAAEKKGGNAETLKTALYMAGGLFAAFPMMYCAKQGVGFGADYLACLKRYNSTGDKCEVEKGSEEDASADQVGATEEPPVSGRHDHKNDSPPGLKKALSLLDFTERLMPEKARAEEESEGEGEEEQSAKSTHKNKRMGLAAAAGVIGYTKKIGDKVRKTPDIFKAGILFGLGFIAGKAQGKWEKAAENFRGNSKKYGELAKVIQEKLDAEFNYCAENAESDGCKERCEEDLAYHSICPSKSNPCEENPEGGDCQERCEEDPTYHCDCPNNPDLNCSDDTGGPGGGGGGGGDDPDGPDDDLDSTQWEQGGDLYGTQGSNLEGAKNKNTDTCVVGSLNSMALDRNCQCRRTNSCSKTNLPKVNFSALGGLPPAVGKAYNSLGAGGDELYRGNLEGAQGHFDNLNRQGAAIQRLKGKVFDKLKNRLNKASGDDGFYDNFQNRANDYLNKAVLSTYGNMAPGGMGSLGGGMGFGGAGGHFGDSFGNDFLSNTQGPQAVFPSGSLGGGGGMTEDFGMEDEFGDPPPGGEGFGGSKDFDNFKTFESDIVDRSSVPLWKIISSRYMRSALPVLLEKKR